ncbi:30S ribosomal protein S13 [Candidatus Gottesmanbacteria bacterium]|nr:30S ribosomal protein S13 [Candidatus Gottesmanbacteria bacterium]
MARIAGIDIPGEKRTDIALTYIYGIGRKNVTKVLEAAHIEGNKRAKELTEDEVNRLQKVIDKNFKVEGDLRREVENNIKRLRETGAYRGLRHMRKLPVHGQRTRSNARTKRGKRVTIGAMKKDDRVKLESTAAKSETKA